MRHASALWRVDGSWIRTCGQVRAARRWQGDCHGAISLVGEPRIPGVKTRSADSATATASATARTVRAPRYPGAYPARRRTYGIYGNAPAAGTAAGEAANRRVPFFRVVGSRKSEVGSRKSVQMASLVVRSTFDRLPYGCLLFMYRLPIFDFRVPKNSLNRVRLTACLTIRETASATKPLSAILSALRALTFGCTGIAYSVDYSAPSRSP